MERRESRVPVLLLCIFGSSSVRARAALVGTGTEEAAEGCAPRLDQWGRRLPVSANASVGAGSSGHRPPRAVARNRMPRSRRRRMGAPALLRPPVSKLGVTPAGPAPMQRPSLSRTASQWWRAPPRCHRRALENARAVGRQHEGIQRRPPRQGPCRRSGRAGACRRCPRPGPQRPFCWAAAFR